MKSKFTVGNLRRVIKESANGEFKPVYGKGVQDDNKKINRQAYNDIKKETSNYDGGVLKKKQDKDGTLLPTENRGMTDLDYEVVDKPFKERVKSQVKGFNSKQDEDLHGKDKLGNGERDPHDLSTQFAKHAKEAKKIKDQLKGTGLTGSTKDKSTIEKESDTMFESKKIKSLNFKHTKFLTEGHMISKVPDEYKKDGNRFRMNDSEGNSYLVEWHDNGQHDITKKVNLQETKKEFNRMKQLWGYKSKDYFVNTTSQSRIDEDKNFNGMVDKMRKLMK